MKKRIQAKKEGELTLYIKETMVGCDLKYSLTKAKSKALTVYEHQLAELLPKIQAQFPDYQLSVA